MACERRCPRCGSAFHCGALDDAPCACFAVHLGDAARAALRSAFTDCVCLDCLRAVQAECAAAAEGADPVPVQALAD